MQTQINISFIIFASAFLAILMVAFVVSFLYITQKRNYKYNESIIQIKQDYESAILNSQIEVQAQTLQQVSEELHDNIGQMLSSVILHIEVLGRKAIPEVKTQAEQTRLLVQEVSEQVRHISRSISPQHIENFGLKDTIQYHADRINRIGVIKIDFKTEGEIREFNPKTELVMFRMVQELMNNAIKHSECENIFIKLKFENERLLISVNDDGKGFDKSQILKNKQFKDGSGLQALEKKARFINCSLTFTSNDKGTKVTLIKDFQNEYN